MEAILNDTWKPPLRGCQTNYSDPAHDPDIYEREERVMEQESNGTQIMKVEQPTEIMPVFTPQQMVARYNQIKECVQQAMEEGITKDYGVIPGTDKPTLLLPGAQKLAIFFGLRAEYDTKSEKDWTGQHHGGEPFFNFETKCFLFHGNRPAAQYTASCNSWEAKYRWRKGERKCPQCGAAAIMKSKFGDGGWYCFNKKGGCGAQFKAGDQSIESQETRRIPNPDIFDQVNSLEKISEKRAFIGAVIAAAAASGFFGQDMDDLAANKAAGNSDHGHDDAIDVEAEPVRTAPTSPPSAQSPPRAAKAPSGATVAGVRQVTGRVEAITENPTRKPGLIKYSIRVGDDWFNTIKKAHAEVAASARASGANCVIQFKYNEQYKNNDITHIEIAGGEPHVAPPRQEPSQDEMEWAEAEANSATGFGPN